MTKTHKISITEINELVLDTMDDWYDFVRENIDAIRDDYGSVSNAYRHAVRDGLIFGGGAAPLICVRINRFVVAGE
jgi:hypothetical protein